jgi:hypothetical protein
MGSFPGAVGVPRMPDWWELAKRILQLSPMAISGAGGGGDRQDPKLETFRRCARAAKGGEDAWDDFCDDLPPDAKQLRAQCYSSRWSEPSRQGFCARNFTPGWNGIE